MSLDRLVIIALITLTALACESKSSSSSDTPSTSGGGGGGGVSMPSFDRLFPTTGTTNAGFGYTGSTPDMTIVADPMCATEATALGLTGTRARLQLGLKKQH